MRKQSPTMSKVLTVFLLASWNFTLSVSEVGVTELLLTLSLALSIVV